MKAKFTLLFLFVWLSHTLSAQLIHIAHTPFPLWKTIYDITQDAQSNIWACGQSGSLAKYDGSVWTEVTIPGFTSDRYQAVQAVNENDVWVGTEDNGLLHFDGTDWTHYNASNSMLPNESIHDIKIDNIGDVWVATSSGVAVISGMVWTIYNSSNSDLTDNTTFDIEFAPNGDVWFANNFKAVRKSGTTWTLWDAFDVTGTFFSTFKNIAFASNGDVYAGTSHGLVKYDGSTWSTTPYMTTPTGSSLQVNYLSIDQNDRIWFGSWNWGLYVHDIPGDFLYGFYSEDDPAVPSFNLRAIFTSTDNHVWLGGVGIAPNGGISEITDIIFVAPLTLTSSTTDVLCNGDSNGSITLDINGGVMPYTYTWSDSNISGNMPMNLPAGTYTVTITDSLNTTLEETITILEPDVLNGTTSSTSEINTNGNGTATVAPIGGVPPYMFLWNDSNNQTTATATNLSQGNYTVTVTDSNNCTFEISVMVDMVTVPLAVATSKVDVLCNGDATGSITLDVSGGVLPYMYAWSDSNISGSMATNLLAGTYTVTVTDNLNVTIEETISIEEPTLLEGTTTSTPEIDANGDGTATVTPTGGVFPYTYLWSDANGQTTATATNLSQGDYTVTITDDNDCTFEISVTVDMITDIQDVENEFKIKISPNPTKDYLNITSKNLNEVTKIQFFSTTGILVFEENVLLTEENNIQLNKINSGVYIIRFLGATGTIYASRIVIL